MSYEKHTWETGETITAEKLNNLEGGVEEALECCGGDETLEPITHANLVALRNSGKLVPGKQYRIINYICTTTQEGSRVVSNPFDIIVVADNETTLNENARACLHDGDTYYSAANHSAVLKSWELKYCIDNDSDRFGWADTTNGKGVVYWLKDERNNECPYDFKQIQFSRDNDGTTNWYYTFSVRDYDAETVTSEDASVSLQDDNGCSNFGNIICSYIDNSGLYLNNIVFDNFFEDYCCSNTFGSGCYDNTFGSGCYDNTFGSGCYDNTFGNNCYDNTFGNNCYDNTFGSSYLNNAFKNYCHDNTFGDHCYHNTFGNYCCFIDFGNYCNYNTFGNYCQFIDFSLNNNGCAYNVLTNVCGTQSNHLAINGTSNNEFVTYVGNNSSGVVKTWVPADTIA